MQLIKSLVVLCCWLYVTGLYGQSNDANVSQNGDNNSTQIEQVSTNSNTNDVNVIQAGNTNAAVSLQEGSENTSYNRQSGVSNDLVNLQKGDRIDNIILQNMYMLAYNDCINGRKNWLSNVRKLLYEYGFNNVWDHPKTYFTKSFIHVFKQRAIDCFLQEWNTNIGNSAVLELYRYIKIDIVYEKYLDILPGNLRNYICKLRL